MPKNSEWKKWREKKLMSQAQMARAMGITERTIQNIEAGVVKPSLKSRRKFAQLRERHSNARKVA